MISQNCHTQPYVKLVLSRVKKYHVSAMTAENTQQENGYLISPITVGKAPNQPAVAAPQHINTSHKNEAPPANPHDFQPDIKQGSLSDRVGTWAFAHKDQMNGVLPNYLIRNAANASIALAGLTAVIVPVRLGFNALVEATKNGKAFTGFSKLDGVLNKIAKEPSVPAILGVGLSFSTFRTLFKTGKRNYDRVFGDNSAHDNAVSFHDLPRNIIKDIKAIAPHEFPATCFAAIPLVMIRNGFGGPTKGMTRDIIGSIPAYTVFFEMTERMYSGFAKDQSALKGIYKETAPTAKHEHDKDRKPYAAFTEDTPVRFAFRKLPAVALGIAPYIALNRTMYEHQAKTIYGKEKLTEIIEKSNLSKVQLGGMNPTQDNYRTAYGKEIKPFLMFPAFTMISEAWVSNYDKLFEKLQNKYHKNQNGI